ncbi:MAG: hypothetical protein SLAVMIC_00294 [uncultured marine phage]|uniref:Uncharacterized protein n=1 Tax=uncultured marine phage TaxID=707152 RepID=A0A8D9CBB6_9VIRU|nr:MAG: hypothetical protein SLAVMIC_00294 [uncultured marine phage]
MRNIKTFENYEGVNGEPNYIGGVDGDWAKPDREQFPEFRDQQLQNGDNAVWITKSGQKLKVKEMTDDHLKNVLNAIINGKIDFKNIDSKVQWGKIIVGELLSR